MVVVLCVALSAQAEPPSHQSPETVAGVTFDIIGEDVNDTRAKIQQIFKLGYPWTAYLIAYNVRYLDDCESIELEIRKQGLVSGSIGVSRSKGLFEENQRLKERNIRIRYLPATPVPVPTDELDGKVVQIPYTDRYDSRCFKPVSSESAEDKDLNLRGAFVQVVSATKKPGESVIRLKIRDELTNRLYKAELQAEGFSFSKYFDIASSPSPTSTPTISLSNVRLPKIGWGLYGVEHSYPYPPDHRFKSETQDAVYETLVYGKRTYIFRNMILIEIQTGE